MTHTRYAHGPRVRVLREARQMNCSELARAVGLSPTYMWRIENEERPGSEQVSQWIADALKVKVQYLTGQLPLFRALRLIVSSLPEEEFAESVGVSPEELRKIELGRLQPDLQVVELMAERLGVHPLDLCPDLRAPAAAPPGS